MRFEELRLFPKCAGIAKGVPAKSDDFVGRGGARE